MKKMIFLLITIVSAISGNALALDMNQVKIHGFVSQGYLKSDNNDYYFADTKDGTFQFNELGINFMSDLSDQLKIGIQFLSKDLGRFGNNEVRIDWAYGDYRLRNWLGFRAGKIKLATGLYNEFRDVDAARACIFLPHSIYNEAYTDSSVAMTGVALYGMLPAGFEYQVQFGKWEIPADGAITTTVANGFKIPINDVKTETVDDTVNFHLLWSPPQVSGLKVVGTYLKGLKWDIITPKATLNYDVSQYVASVEYSRNNLTLSAEYCRAYSKANRGEIITSDLTKEMYYGMASYRFTDWFETGIYYSVSYRSKDDRDGELLAKTGALKETAWLKDYALFTRFDINQNWIMKLEAHHIDGLNQLLDVTSKDLSDKGFLFAVKTTFSF
jgi:hypothetical protein